MEIKYLKKCRKELGGPLPSRRETGDKVNIPQLTIFDRLLNDTGDREISTTQALVQAITILCKDKIIGKRVVPIVPDEARTFGMEGMFRQMGIFSAAGQKYVPHDREQIMYYKVPATRAKMGWTKRLYWPVCCTTSVCPT